MTYRGQKNGPFGRGVQAAEVPGDLRTGVWLSSCNSRFHICALAVLSAVADVTAAGGEVRIPNI